MSSFICEKCGKEILDTPYGYITSCEHYPIKPTIQKQQHDLFDELVRILNEPPNEIDEEFKQRCKEYWQRK